MSATEEPFSVFVSLGVQSTMLLIKEKIIIIKWMVFGMKRLFSVFSTLQFMISLSCYLGCVLAAFSIRSCLDSLDLEAELAFHL